MPDDVGFIEPYLSRLDDCEILRLLSMIFDAEQVEDMLGTSSTHCRP